jgi:aldehyde:ferredoxin oxidoreductase
MFFPEANILRVDLTSKVISAEKLPGEVYRLYPGGSALALYFILNEMPVGVDPLGPENMLIYSVSPLTGLPISGASRLVITAKSPLTETIGDSQSGGFFPAYLKANGWDAIIFKGQSERPVYLYIDGENVELRSAEHLWGKVTGETEKLIMEELGTNKIEISQIGPAGENKVRFACILSRNTRANGRNGLGAVMGSKNLKAVVVKHSKGVTPKNIEPFGQLAQSVKQRLKDNQAVAGLGKYGTDVDLEAFSDEGFLPTRNWTTGYFPEGAKNITGITMYETILKGRDTCYACSVRCKRVVEIPGKVDPLYGGPEYETCASLGSYCGVTNLEDVALANQLCNMYGLDTISCGGTISFAMECYEHNLLNIEDTGGLKLNFGNSEAMLKLIELIALRKGFGNILAEGSKRVADKMGGEALKFSISVKGQELPAHMPQYKPSVGIIYAVNPFGADHQSSEHDPFLMSPPDSQERRWLGKLGIWKGYDNPFEMDDEKIRYAFETQCYFSILDTLCLCQFVWGPSWELLGPDDMVGLCKYGIGWDTSLVELMKVGERRINMMRYFNAREGFTKEDDYLPERIFEPLPDGKSKGIGLDREKFLKGKELYYQFAGWDTKTGNPTEATLRKLSLSWLLDGRRN